MNIPYKYNFDGGDRFLAFPFLFGALAGGAVVGLTRPRPIIGYPAYPGYGYGYYGGGGYFGYRPPYF